MGKMLSIMRGPSGSGKSTHARMIKNAFEGAVIVSADNYFMHDGEYKFDPSLISKAHNDCYYKFLDAIDHEVEEIVVDNTNIHNWEFANYIKAGRMNGYEIEVIEFMATSVEDIKTCIYRNQHNVPAEIIMRMCCEFEPCFSQKNVTVHGIV
jgi:predicted ABC-type ATPase